MVKFNTKKLLFIIIIILLILFVASCKSNTKNVEEIKTPVMANTPTITIQSTQKVTQISPSSTETKLPTKEVYDPTVPDSWKELPVIPATVSQKMKDLYQEGIKNGLNQNAFSKAGDCDAYTQYFLAPFDLSAKGYRLGNYQSLATVISRYKGSFSRVSMAAKSGFNVASVLSPMWSDKEQCKTDKNEIPLICEIRINKPSIILIMFGTNDAKMSSRETFEKRLRMIVDYSIQNRVIPVLATKADNLEGDGSINAIIAKVAYDYDVPVWNLWRAMNELPQGGLEEDKTHPTYAPPFFDNDENMQKGWPVRNLTALQVLEKLAQELNP